MEEFVLLSSKSKSVEPYSKSVILFRLIKVHVSDVFLLTHNFNALRSSIKFMRPSPALFTSPLLKITRANIILAPTHLIKCDQHKVLQLEMLLHNILILILLTKFHYGMAQLIMTRSLLKYV